MKVQIDNVIQGDCLEGLAAMDPGSVNLAFADPPFNIGYDYDEYDDRQDHARYLAWSRDWIAAVWRVLQPDGTFWLAIGDEYAAELRLIARNAYPGLEWGNAAGRQAGEPQAPARAALASRRRSNPQEKRRRKKADSDRDGFHCRSWIIWYYTFGVHCTQKFTRSHAHLFHFVKNPKNFTFNVDDIRVPSARQLVYADKRANPKGRMPDDTWLFRPTATDEPARADKPVPSDEAGRPPTHNGFILRPQDLPDGFAADSDTWYFSRVAGTFRERRGWHGCQMPEQLLGRIIRASSVADDIVLDPFTGSGTTLVVARKLARQYVGFEISDQYATEARRRLQECEPGQPLTGVENPLTSAPPTLKGRQRPPSKNDDQATLVFG